ncbi:SAM domain-containing protein [Mesorhizobium muleiense]|uniref:SAM domain-containing protein n=1 Tax=Mesorhizobium muleiense TaxID=1004279 RepID=UPI001F3315A4|nr:SAM domain-containing protein [Mesorhizobium muleiense]MCF6113141.1 SAM domain-containing protein [Mesorhizobium muleiense]
MSYPVLDEPISPLRQRLIDDMNMRRFSRETPRNYLRDIGRLATFLGLEQYEQAFRENAIDADVLPELTDADLEKLGMLLGHRKRLLALSHPAWSKEDVSITGQAGTAPQSRAPWVWPALCLRVRLRRPWLEMATPVASSIIVLLSTPTPSKTRVRVRPSPLARFFRSIRANGNPTVSSPQQRSR